MTEFEVPFGDAGDRGRKRPKHRVVAVGLIAVAACVAIAAAVSFGGGRSFEIETAQGARQELAAAGEEPQPQAQQTVFVHVTGAVASPGLYEVTEGSRVAQAVEAAGGFAEGAATGALNLARVVADGEQVVVPTQAEIDAAQSSASSAGGASVGGAGTGVLGGKVNINTATVEQLDSLPGIGASTAAKIVADRESNGPFSTTEDLKRVSGIGDKKFAALADEICVG